MLKRDENKNMDTNHMNIFKEYFILQQKNRFFPQCSGNHPMMFHYQENITQ